ncbi:MAG TPA: ATP-binding protein, partial [Ferrovibrio sp.]
DTGRGIDEKRLKAIVEPFGVSENIYTRSRGGIGLGLSITRSLMEMHAGRLSLASRPGHGFEAQLVFPAHRAEQPAGAAVG